MIGYRIPGDGVDPGGYFFGIFQLPGITLDFKEDILYDVHTAFVERQWNHPNPGDWRECPDFDCARYRKGLGELMDKAWKYEDLQS